VTRPAITGATRILGLIADPVAQARSPAMGNALLERRGRFGEYVLVPMQVSSDGLADCLLALRHLRNFGGAIVSMPHKTAIVELLDELTAEAQLVGAVNVVQRRADGSLLGTVLDGEGFVGGLRNAGHRVAGARCLLAGAGGAASAVAFALAKYGCASICLVNRSRAKAEALADRLRRAFPSVVVSADAASLAHIDIAINATSLGMKPDDALPLTDAVIARSALVAECVIAPEMTRLLETAQRRGCSIHTGVPMLEAQIGMMLAFMGAA
jgi:shikimate dehydrogenase